MNRAAAKLVNSGLRLLRLLPEHANATAGGGQATAKSLLIAAGIETISGDADVKTAPASALSSAVLPELDSSLPRNIALLTAVKVPVPASVVLKELDWSLLKNSPIMSETQYATVKREIESTLTQLQRCEQTAHHLDPEFAKDLVKRFWCWVGLTAVASTLQVSPSGAEAVRQVLGEATESTMPMLRKLEQTILRHLEAGHYDKAELFAKRAIQSCDRLAQLLDASYVQLTRSRINAEQCFSRCLAAAGGVFVVSLACDYLGFLPEVAGTALQATTDVVKDLAENGLWLLLGTAVVDWLMSSNAKEYMDKLSDAQLLRLRMKHRLEDLVNQILLARDDSEAAAVA